MTALTKIFLTLSLLIGITPTAMGDKRLPKDAPPAVREAVAKIDADTRSFWDCRGDLHLACTPKSAIDTVAAFLVDKSETVRLVSLDVACAGIRDGLFDGKSLALLSSLLDNSSKLLTSTEERLRADSLRWLLKYEASTATAQVALAKSALRDHSEPGWTNALNCIELLSRRGTSEGRFVLQERLMAEQDQRSDFFDRLTSAIALIDLSLQATSLPASDRKTLYHGAVITAAHSGSSKIFCDLTSALALIRDQWAAELLGEIQDSPSLSDEQRLLVSKMPIIPH